MSSKREWRPQRVGYGTVLQSGIPHRPQPYSAGDTKGLLLRGVVTATYLVDDANHPAEEPVQVYCDVLVYSGMRNTRYMYLPRCVVVQDRGGALHSGRVWKPRAASIDISGSTNLNIEQATNPAYMDGDHVLVGFFDNDFSQPVILGGIAHPSRDVGNQDRDAGNRLNLKLADGDPDFWKHHGVYYGVSDTGDFVVDTTRGTDGTLGADGKEADPPGDGSTGNVALRLPVGSTLTIEVDGGPSLTIEEKDGNATLTLGDGAESGVIFSALKTAFDTHVHPTGVGPSGPPTTPLVATAEATKLKIPS